VTSLLSSSLLLLAQDSSGAELDKAKNAIDTVDKLGKAGPVTLALCLMIAAIVFAVIMMRKNWKLREDHANELKARETEAKSDADTRLKEVLSAEQERRETEKEMLREMVNRGHEATQALEGSNRAIEAFRQAMDAYQRRLDDLDRNQEKRFDEILRAVNRNQRGDA